MANAMLVTGGSRGIGAAVCRLAAKSGWAVAVNFTSDEAAANEVVRDITSAGGTAIAVRGDVSIEADVLALYDAAEQLGPVTAVINNAGIVAPIATLADMDAARLKRVFDVNVLGAYLVAREVARRMPTDRGGPGGAMVISSSAAARLGSPGEFIDYAGSKGAMDTLTLGLCKELGATGVRVNAVRPGLIETDIHASAGAPDRIERLVGNVPMQRSGSAEEVAEVILWLAGPQSSYVTGALIDVAGGR